MIIALALFSGIAWTVVYVEAIRVGLRDQTYAMPVAALGLNFAWECIYTVHGVHGETAHVQAVVNGVWACADIGILYTYFRFARREFPLLPAALVHLWGVAMVGVGFVSQWLFMVKFGNAHNEAAAYSAFLQNALMSGLFIAMFVARGGSRGQTRTLAVAKWLGTLAPTIQIGILYGDS